MAQILFVSKNPDVCKEFQNNATAKGWEADVVTNRLQALENLKEKEYKLVITGMVFPDFDGAQLVTYLNKAKPDTVIIVYTGTITAAQLYFLYNERNVFKIFIRPMPFEGMFQEAIEEALELYDCRVADRIEYEDRVEKNRRQRTDLAQIKKQIAHIQEYKGRYEQFLQDMMKQCNQYLPRQIQDEMRNKISAYEQQLLSLYRTENEGLVSLNLMKQQLEEMLAKKEGNTFQIMIAGVTGNYQTSSIEKVRYLIEIFTVTWKNVFGSYREYVKIESEGYDLVSLEIRFEQSNEGWNQAKLDRVKEAYLLMVQGVAEAFAKELRRVNNANFITYRMNIEMERK